MKHNALIGVHDKVELPACNEMVAVLIGCDLVAPKVPISDKDALKQFLGIFEGVDIVYKQNTADEVNVVLPVFPEFDRRLQEMKMNEEELEYIVGGEGLVAGICALISVILVTIGATVAMKLTGAFVIKSVAAIIGGVVLGSIGAAVSTVALSVAAGVGVGIAAGAGAFNMDDDPIHVAFAS